MVSRWSDNSWLVGGQIIVDKVVDNSWLVGGQIIVG